jgi:hypothetical protein
LSEFKEDGKVVFIKISSQNKIKTPTFKNWVKLKASEFFLDEDEFNEELEEILKITLELSG